MCPRCAILLFDGRERKGRNDHTDIQGENGAKAVPASISRSHGPGYVFARRARIIRQGFNPRRIAKSTFVIQFKSGLSV
jgi:hypothetical protein